MTRTRSFLYKLFSYVLLGLVTATGILAFQYWKKPSNTQTVSTLNAANTKTVALIQAAPISTIQSEPFSYADAVQNALPAVVNIYTKRVEYTKRLQNPLADRFFGNSNNQNQQVKTGSGSGVIFSKSGYILTNYHVIRGASAVHVLLSDGRDFPAKLIGLDPDTDLAVLKIDAPNLSPIPLATKTPVRIGDVVLAIGNPFSVGQTVTMGIVSAKGRDRLGLSTYESFIQTDAAINPGNSGGALVNANGDLVGINTAIFTKDGGTQGIGFAIPINIATYVLSQIVEHGRVIRGWIGAEGRDLTAAMRQYFNIPSGVIISQVVRGGPADMAGLQRGDVITHLNDETIQDAKDVVTRIGVLKPGDGLKVKGIRGEQPFEATLIAVQRPLFNR